MTSTSEWYSDPTTLLEELRRGQGRRIQPPSIPGYDEIRELRRGGQGIVYQAVQRSTKRKVAIKVLLEGALASDVHRRRFEREIDLAAGLRHPSIVSVYDSGVTSDNRPYLVMEFIEGRPLDDHLREGTASKSEEKRPLGRRAADFRRSLELFAEVAEAVNYAHQRGVIHRDLKPSNIRVDVEGRPRILDFGLAKLAAESPVASRMVSASGQFLGSLPWASPEQAEGRAGQIDIRSDVYSLGVMLFRALTGRFPYEVSVGIRETLNNILHAQPDRPSAVEPQLNVDVDTIVLKCLAKEPARRYQTAGELARDLHAYLVGEPIEARRDSAWYVLRKSLRRYRLIVLAIVGFLALSSLFSVVMAVMYRNTLAARDAESRARLIAERSAEESRRIEGFLEDMLASVDPAAARGRDVTVLRELLDEAARRIEVELANQPQVAAALRLTIGKTYFSLGVYPEAQRHLTVAWETFSRELGDRDARTLAARNALGALMLAQARKDDAEPFVRETLRLAREVLGDRGRETLRAECGWAQLLQLQGKPAEAMDQWRSTWERCKEFLGPQDRDTEQSMNELGASLVSLGEYAEAEALYRRALNHADAGGNVETPARVATLSALAMTLRKQNRLAGAEPLLREALDIAHRVLGDEHPLSISTLNNTASVLHSQGRLPEAESMYRNALELYLRSLGSEHPETLTLRNNLARVLDDQGRLDEAEPMLQENVDIYRRTLGARHPDTLMAANNYANLLERRGRVDEAEALYREVLAERAETLGPEHPDTLLSMNNLAMLLQTRKKWTEAESLIRNVVETRRRLLGEESLDTLIAMNNLGSLLTVQGRAPEAEELLARAVELGEKTLPPGHWFNAAFRGNYGRALGRLGRYEEGEKYLLDGYGIAEQALGTTHPQTITVARKLIDLYETWGKPEKAEIYRTRIAAVAVPVTSQPAP